MSNKTEGFVVKLFTKSGNSARGKWVADSFKIKDKAGNEDPFFYQMGFRDKGKLDTPPSFGEGDYIRFDYDDKDDSARTYKKGSGIKVGNAPTPPPASAPAASQGSASATGSTQQNIHYQNSRTAAIQTVETLLSHGGLPISGAKSKAGEAQRYEEITAAIDKLTVQYFNDLESFRLFETVSDSGKVNVSADGALPDDEVEEEGPVLEDGDEPL